MNPTIRALLLKIRLFRDLREGREMRAARESGLARTLFIDYPVRSIPRYGHGKPPHPRLFEILSQHRAEYARTLAQFPTFKATLETIPVHTPDDPASPFWLNRYLQGLDPVSLYAFACLKNPQLYIEIGSGNSTKFMRRAIKDHGLRTRILSIDPHPRAEIDDLCDDIRREPLEETDLAMFDSLRDGDIVFMDGSHRVFMNSDVSAFFLDVLPRLRPGVLVYIDDIFLPFDYPPEWIPRYYSEQYLLAVLLLAKAARYQVLLPCTFVGNDPGLMQILDPLWRDGPIAEAAGPGNGFWLRIC